jgi:hypothetical protein
LAIRLVAAIVASVAVAGLAGAGAVAADPFAGAWMFGDTGRTRAPYSTEAPLPLGRLVLTAAEAPGLKRNAAKPSGAKKALADALRPARLPRFTPKQAQMARFGKESSQVTSLAFVMKTPLAAKAAAKAIGKAGRGTRVKLGSGGYSLHRRQSAVVWYRGRVLGAVVFTMAQKPSVRTKIAVDYGRVADARVERALSQTAYSRILEKVGAKGQISRKTALDLFALSYAPLPGTKRPSGPAGRIEDGTVAARNILRLWKTLTPAQRDAAAKLLGIASVSLPGLRWTSGRKDRADYGDPGFTPDTALTETAKQFAAVYQQKTGFQLKQEIVAGQSDNPLPYTADSLPLDAQGNYTQSPTLCRIRLTSPLLAFDADYVQKVIAHETFHCMQFGMTGTTTWIAKKFNDWIGQGTAEWAAMRVTGPPWPYSQAFSAYLNTCDTMSLYARIDASAVGFFGHTDDAVEDFWGRIEAAVVLGFKYGNGPAYDASRGTEAIFLDTWASSALIGPAYGLAWTSSSPVAPPPGAGCHTVSIIGDAPVMSDPLTVRLYTIENVINVDRPLMHVQIEQGHARISDGQFVDQTVKDAWFWTGPEEPDCPAGTEGTPPPAPTLERPAKLGLTGGKNAGAGTVTFVSLKEFCKQKQPPPPTECVKGGGAGSGAGTPCPPGTHVVPKPTPGQPGLGKKDEDPPDPLGCTGYGCAFSAADPHLRPFGGNWYDFQAVGEFTLVRSLQGDLEAQVRQEPWPGSKVVSMNTAVAMRVAGDRVAVYKGQPLSVRVNERPVLLKRKDVRLPRGGVLRPLRRGELDVVWPDGTVIRVTPSTNVHIDLVVSLGASRLGKVTGLLGDNDGKAADDFKTRSGRRLDPDLIRGTGKRAYSLLYGVYGDSWRVTPKTSLFDYAPGQSTRTFTNRRFPARIATTETLTPAQRRKAEKTCRRMGFTDKRVLEACILDVTQTGSFGFATALALSQLATKKAPKKQPPPPAKPGATVRWGTKTYTYRPASTQDGCTRRQRDIAFEAQFTSSPGKKLVYGFKLIVLKGTKDGTYTTGAQAVFEIEGKIPVAIENLTVKLAGNRTRGTFSGNASTPGKEPVSGSFTC